MAPTTPLIVFTDGSCIGKGNNAKCCSATVWPNKEFHDTAFYMPPDSVRTNNRAEYYAAIRALGQANDIDPSRTRELHIHTDSMLLINTVTLWAERWCSRGWEKSSPGEIKNLDYVKILYGLNSERNVKWIHVKAHTGMKDYNSVWNDIADRVATENVLSDDITISLDYV